MPLPQQQRFWHTRTSTHAEVREASTHLHTHRHTQTHAHAKHGELATHSHASYSPPPIIVSVVCPTSPHPPLRLARRPNRGHIRGGGAGPPPAVICTHLILYLACLRGDGDLLVVAAVRQLVLVAPGPAVDPPLVLARRPHLLHRASVYGSIEKHITNPPLLPCLLGGAVKYFATTPVPNGNAIGNRTPPTAVYLCVRLRVRTLSLWSAQHYFLVAVAAA